MNHYNISKNSKNNKSIFEDKNTYQSQNQYRIHRRVPPKGLNPVNPVKNKPVTNYVCQRKKKNLQMKNNKKLEVLIFHSRKMIYI